MATDIKEAIRRLIYEYVSKGANEVMATQEAVAASTTKTDKASLSLEKAFGSLERRYVDTVRTQQDYAKVQDKVNAAVAQNPELQERANVVLAEARKHFDNLATGADKGSIAATALARTLSRTIGPLALIGVAVAAVSSAMEFMEPIAVRVGADIYNRFSQAYPAVARFAEGIYNAAKQFIELEQAKAKVDAINAALRGVASSAQLAALNLQSINQKMVSQRGLAEAALAAEQIANHVMRLRELYPGVTQEIAKQLELQQAQLGVAQARTPAEQQIAQEKLRQVQLSQQGISAEEQQLIIAGERAISEENIAKQKEAQNLAINNAANAQAMAQADTTSAVSYTGSALSDVGDQIQVNTGYARSFTKETSNWSRNVEATTSSLEGMGMFMQSAFYAHLGELGYLAGQNEEERMIESKLASGDLSAYVGQQDISSPAAASASLANILRLGVQDGLGNVTRLIDAVSDPGTQASLVQQAIDYIQRTQPANLAREEMINDLNGKLEGLINSTDSLNSTMQNALSPFYSQDPRTTHLGFRAGVVGNPEWQVGGASNANPLAAILGPGATAPGMAEGGSFVVGGGYSANDNKIAAFPVASGEQVTVNRNRAGAKGGQVIHIDNRTIINGRVDADVFAQMKVSKYQQAQRMRSGLGAVA